jgi:hypothetical protein
VLDDRRLLAAERGIAEDGLKDAERGYRHSMMLANGFAFAGVVARRRRDVQYLSSSAFRSANASDIPADACRKFAIVRAIAGAHRYRPQPSLNGGPQPTVQHSVG